MENEIKPLIINALALENIGVEDIDSNAPVFNDGLGLDSIDVLDLGLTLRKKYNVKIEAEKEDVERIFSSVASSLSDYIQSALEAPAAWKPMRKF